MLNLSSLVLAASLLPLDFAVLRIGGGLVVGVLVTYLVSVIAPGWAEKAPRVSPPNKLEELSSRTLDAFSRWFQFEAFLGDRSPDSPATLVATWLGAAWRLGRVVAPVLFVGSVVTAAVVMAIPSPTKDFVGIVAAAAFGTLLMAPTWTELPIALGLISQVLTGPAAALLLTLPAVSIPCLVIIGGATANWRAALLLGLLVFGVSWWVWGSSWPRYGCGPVGHGAAPARPLRQ